MRVTRISVKHPYISRVKMLFVCSFWWEWIWMNHEISWNDTFPSCSEGCWGFALNIIYNWNNIPSGWGSGPNSCSVQDPQINRFSKVCHNLREDKYKGCTGCTSNAPFKHLFQKPSRTLQKKHNLPMQLQLDLVQLRWASLSMFIPSIHSLLMTHVNAIWGICIAAK
jgi:hypothetical protein